MQAIESDKTAYSSPSLTLRGTSADCDELQRTLDFYALPRKAWERVELPL